MHVDHDDCRACVGVEELMRKAREAAAKKKKKEGGSSSTQNSSAPNSSSLHAEVTGPTRMDCPANRDSLGTATWTLLHTMSVYYPEKPVDEDKRRVRSFLTNLAHLYPCNVCAADLRADLKEEPPAVNSRKEFAEWMCRLHNKVNEKTGKPSFDCSRIFERWRDGWSDGSCDY